MMKNYRWIIGIMVLSLLMLTSGFLIVNAQPVEPGDCDGTGGDDTINCTTNPASPDDQIDGDLGDDNITQGAGVTTTYIDADGAATGGDVAGNGDGGNDTVVNDGTVTVSISTDYVTGKPGNDSITNNGSAGALLGDETEDSTAQNGDDVIVNNGTVTGTIFGDANPVTLVGVPLMGGTGGNDTITNNGTVGADIIADSGATGVGGSDTITNNGTVNGSIDAGDGADKVTLGETSTVGGGIAVGTGNDTVTIGDGALVGTLIDGGEDKGDTDTDILQFKFNDPTEGAAAAAALAAMSPAGGTITFGGHTYTWANFEQLVALFTAAGGGGNNGGGNNGGGNNGGGNNGGGNNGSGNNGGGSIIVTVSVNAGLIKDGRANGYDLAAPFAVYCVANDFVRVIDIQPNGTNVLAFEVKFEAINKAIASAKSTAQSVDITSGAGDFLLADANGSLVAYGPTLDGSKTYTFHFQPDCSASANGVEG